MIKYIISTLISFAAIISTSIAQDSTSIDKPFYTLNGKRVYYNQEEIFKDYDNKFGFTASQITGYGLSYQRHISNGFRIEINGSYFTSDDLRYSRESFVKNYTYYTIGLELQKELYKENNSKVFFFIGVGYFYDYEERNDKFGPSSDDIRIYEKLYQTYKTIAAGIGLNFQYTLSRFLIFDFDVAYYHDRKFEDYYDSTRALEYQYRSKNTFHYDLGFGIGIYVPF